MRFLQTIRTGPKDHDLLSVAPALLVIDATVGAVLPEVLAASVPRRRDQLTQLGRLLTKFQLTLGARQDRACDASATADLPGRLAALLLREADAVGEVLTDLDDDTMLPLASSMEVTFDRFMVVLNVSRTRSSFCSLLSPFLMPSARLARSRRCRVR